MPEKPCEIPAVSQTARRADGGQPSTATAVAASPPEPKYITRAGLIGKRGWTETAVQRFLPECEKEVKNQHYGGYPVRLYLLARAEEVEATPEFQEWRKSNTGRKRGSSAGVETKRRKLVDYIEGLRIDVPEFPADSLVRRAVQNYNEHHYGYESGRRSRDWDFVPETVNSVRSDVAFRERITVNYLRHELTSYERNLREIFGKVGINEGKRLLRAKVYAAIATVYPELAGECRRQQKERESRESREIR